MRSRSKEHSTFSEYVLSNAERLWVESDLSGKQRVATSSIPAGRNFR
jgi:hypothetical protein